MKRIFLFTIFLLFLCSPAWGADRTILTGATVINGSDGTGLSGSGAVSAGDTLTFASGGTWNDYIAIYNLRGDSENPITIRNYSGEQAVINLSGEKRHAALYFYHAGPSCYVTINGNNNPPGIYGIRLTGSVTGGQSANYGIYYGGTDTTFATDDWEGMKIQYVHIDGTASTEFRNGVHVPRMYPPGASAGNPVAWGLPDWKISNCKVNNVSGSGIYLLGNNVASGLYLDSPVYHDLIIQTTGSLGLNIKYSDNVHVYDVFIKDPAQTTEVAPIGLQFRRANGIIERVFLDLGDKCSTSGIYLLSTSYLQEDPYGNLIAPTMNVTIQNCVVYDPSDDTGGMLKNGGSCPNLLIRNNTFVNPDTDDNISKGIYFDAYATGIVSGNLFAGSITTAIDATSITPTDTWSGTVAAAFFEDPTGIGGDYTDDFALTASTPAAIIDEIASNFPYYDFLNLIRVAPADIGAYEYGAVEPPTGCNDISVDPNCVFWYEFSNNGNDSNTQIATYNLSDGNSPTYEGAACSGGTDTGFVTLVDADNDYMYSAAFDQLTGDFTAYFCFTLKSNLDEGEVIHFGQYETTDNERTWLLFLSDSAGAPDENYASGWVGHNDGAGADGDGVAGIYAESGGSNFPVLINVSYRFVIRYDNSEDDFFVHLYTASNGTEVATNSNLALLGANTQYTGSAVEVGIGCFFAGGVATVKTEDIEIHEIALFNEFLTEAESDKLGDGTFTGATAAVSTITTTANLTSAGFHSIYVNFNRAVSAPSPGPPTIQVSYDYPTDPVTYTFSTMTDSDTAEFRTYAFDKYRQDVFGDAEIADAIVLPDGTTWTDPQDVAVSLDISGLGTYPGNTVANPSTLTSPFTVGVGRDIAKISDLVGQLSNDVYHYLGPVTDNVDITVDGVTIIGIGRIQVNTGTLIFTGDNNHVRGVWFSEGVIDNGVGNTYCPFCESGIGNLSSIIITSNDLSNKIVQ